MSKINFTLQLIIAVPLIFELNYVLHLWLGNTIPDYTTIFTILVVLVNCINTLNEPVSIVMVSTGKIKLVKSVSLIIITSVVPIGYFLLSMGLPPYYIYVTMLGLTLLNQVSCVIIMTKKFPVITLRAYIKNIALPCILLLMASLIVPFITTHLLKETFLRVITTAILSAGASSLLAFFLCFNRQEKNIILLFVKNKMEWFEH